MGNIKKHPKVKLIVGMIARDETLFEKAKMKLEEKYSETDYESKVMDFNKTDYYRDEMGENLKRKFVAFSKLVLPEDLVEIKREANAIEKSGAFFKNGRRINLDPGYVSLAKLVLASTKDYSHRVYLSKGIFAEVTLMYFNGKFNAKEWTYPDYATEEYKKIFGEIREIYKRQLKSKK